MIVKNDPKTIRAWTFYDWANSVFPLVITSAIFPNFYDAVTATKNVNDVIISTDVVVFGNTFKNTDIYSYVYAFALSIVAVIVPILSGIADYFGNKKRFLQFFTYLGSISCMSLYFFNVKHLELSFIPFITATIGFWGSLVYYNSYLPEIADIENQDRVSARGFAMGYLGSSLLLIICLALIIGISKEFTRYTFLLVGIWWIGFAQITFKKLPNTVGGRTNDDTLKKDIFTKGFKEIKHIFKNILKIKRLKRFLASYFFYNMGVQTIMVMAVLFARNEIKWPNENTKTISLIISILIIQFVAIAGSFAFSFTSKKIGNIKSIGIAIFLWMIICVYTYAVAKLPYHFYIIAAAVGMVMGGIQSLSRSTYSKFLPETNDHASYFSFYDVLEKLGMIVGTVTFGIISQFTGGMRPSVLALTSFFAIGFILLLFIPTDDTTSISH